MERKILSVFLASPSDLGDERKALRDVVQRLNKIYGRGTGWEIELWGWEDTLAGFSRPQALINNRGKGVFLQARYAETWRDTRNIEFMKRFWYDSIVIQEVIRNAHGKSSHNLR